MLSGGDPATTLLVVNGDSPASLRIANAYQRRREIPPEHVVWLHGVSSMDVIDIDTFRRKVWSPIGEFLQDHGLAEEIDTIAYSADFPYAVDFSADLKARGVESDRYRGHIASLTGLTYFARRVAAGDIGYLGPNHYFRDFAGPRIRPSPVPAVELDEATEKALRKQAKRALRDKDYATAVAAYERLASAHPNNPRERFDLARSLAAAGRTEEALRALGEAIDGGWTQSLLTRRDPLLAALRERADFEALLERMATAFGPFQLAHGFRNHYIWSSASLLSTDSARDLDRYYLSTLLAYTGERGNSLPEVLGYLERAASSDGTHPNGTVYLLENPNVRSVTRQPLFHSAVAELAKLGRRAEILSSGEDGQPGDIPWHKDDVIGAVVGAPEFDWERSQSRLLPGAIAESLTSYGGHFKLWKQTKLSEFLRHGAAGSSGAVAEPFAFPEKFPLPLLHVYYAEGCSLAESFYQSILFPYQLIIVGDPLARPFASFARVRLETPAPSSAWHGTVPVRAEVDAAGRSFERVELWVDGQYVADLEPGETTPWDTRALEDGYHELRLVAVEANRIETRSYVRVPIVLANSGHRMTVDESSRRVAYGEPISLGGTAPGAIGVEIWQGHRQLASNRVDADRWQLTIDSKRLGMGTVGLLARASFAGGAKVRSAPIDIEVGAPVYMKPSRVEPPGAAGLRAQVRNEQGVEHELVMTRLGGPLRELANGGPRGATIALGGYFEVSRAGFYQLMLSSLGRVAIDVNGRRLLQTTLAREHREAIVPLGLEAGWHRLDLQLVPPERPTPFLEVVLAGDQVARVLSEDWVRH